jgi:Fe2+ transport system protein FeoA
MVNQYLPAKASCLVSSLGLKTGAAFELVERAPFSGPLRLVINGESHFIGHELARTLRVCAPHEFELA